MDYTIVIGLEVHVQLLTESKMFCGVRHRVRRCRRTRRPDPVSLGLPGTLPVMNRKAFELALKTAVALNCRDRPVHQVGPQELLLSRPAQELSDQPVRPAVQPRRLAGDPRPPKDGSERQAGRHHPRPPRRGRRQELHDERPAAATAAGRPEPRRHAAAGDRHASPTCARPEEAKAYLEELRLTLRELGVSDCEMQEGSLRCDANVNLHIPKPTAGTTPRRSSRSRT